MQRPGHTGRKALAQKKKQLRLTFLIEARKGIWIQQGLGRLMAFPPVVERYLFVFDVLRNSFCIGFWELEQSRNLGCFVFGGCVLVVLVFWLLFCRLLVLFVPGMCYRILAGGILLHVSSAGPLLLLVGLDPLVRREQFFHWLPLCCVQFLLYLTFLSLVTWLKALGTSRKKIA